MNGYAWAVEHCSAFGDMAVYKTAHPNETEARRVVEECREEGRHCRLLRAEIGPWEQVPEAVPDAS